MLTQELQILERDLHLISILPTFVSIIRRDHWRGSSFFGGSVGNTPVTSCKRGLLVLKGRLAWGRRRAASEFVHFQWYYQSTGSTCHSVKNRSVASLRYSNFLRISSFIQPFVLSSASAFSLSHSLPLSHSISVLSHPLFFSLFRSFSALKVLPHANFNSLWYMRKYFIKSHGNENCILSVDILWTTRSRFNGNSKSIDKVVFVT